MPAVPTPSEPRVELENFLDHRRSLAELIEAINLGDWMLALTKAKEWRSKIESLLLTQFSEPNKVAREFESLYIKIIRRMPHDIKCREIRESIALILDKVSEYGLSMGKPKQSYKVPKTLENLVRVIDLHLGRIFSLGPMSKEYANQIDNIKTYLTALEEQIKIIQDEDPKLMGLAELCLSEIANARNQLNAFLLSKQSNKDIGESFKKLMDQVGKLSRALESDERRRVIYEVFEEQYDVDLPAQPKPVELEEGEVVLPPKEPIEGFDWVDAEWEQILTHPKVILIIGHRGEGKSSAGWSILEYYARKYGLRAYLVNMKRRPIPDHKRALLPDWITIINDPDDAPPRSVIFLDEVYMRYHARTTARSDAPEMDKVLELSRQNEQTFIYVAQESRKIDPNIFSSIDILLIKRPTEWRAKSEREEVREIVSKALEEFKKVDNPKKYVFVQSHDPYIQKLKRIGLASFWSEELSRFYEGW
ncbi:hypothetical protein DRP07_00300 [Archaeoglobales archaeon]|nr:MAG: hypothetical protein DRP07_00300 [Archaeoglobales archaeon]